MTSVAGQCWMGIGSPAQQSGGIRALAMGLIADSDNVGIPFPPLFPSFRLTKAFVKARWEWLRIALPIDPLQQGNGGADLQ